jgi:hypothetical protein
MRLLREGVVAEVEREKERIRAELGKQREKET